MVQLPDGTSERNFALFFDSLDKSGPGYIQWNGKATPAPIYQARFTQARQLTEHDWECQYVGGISIIGYDDGKPLGSLS